MGTAHLRPNSILSAAAQYNTGFPAEHPACGVVTIARGGGAPALDRPGRCFHYPRAQDPDLGHLRVAALGAGACTPATQFPFPQSLVGP